MKTLQELIREEVPKINPDIAAGYVGTQQHTFEPFISGVVQAVSRRLPPSIEYHGCRRCTPEEEYRFATKNRYNSTTYEFAPSTFYLMRFDFSYQNQPLSPLYLYMPYLEAFDVMRIRGSKYSVCGVLADRFISVTNEGIFVPLTCDRLNFARLPHRFYENGKRKLDYVIYSSIYHNEKTKPTGSKATVTMKTCVLHYLLCEYGLAKTAQSLGIKTLVYGTTQAEKDRHRENGYVIFESDGLKPKGYRDGEYRPSKLWLGVKREEADADGESHAHVIRGFVASFYYIVDHFPNRTVVEHLESIDFWRILLGHAIFADRIPEGTLLNQIQLHMDTLSRYVDSLSIMWASMSGLVIEDFQDILIYLMKTYTKQMISSAESSASMYGKSLLVHRFIFDDIVQMLFRMLYGILPLFSKKSPTHSEVDKAFRQTFKPFLINQLNREHHPEVESVSVASPCAAFRMTSRVVLQANAVGQKSSTFDPHVMGLDASIAEVCNYMAITKNEPTGRGQINVYANVQDGNIVRSEEFRELLDHVQQYFKR